MGKPSSKGKYVVKVGLNDIYVLATKKPDTTKKHGYSMTFDYRIYKNGKLVEKGLKSKDSAVAKSVNFISNKTNRIMNYGKEFKKFAMSDRGISGLNLDYYQKHIEGVTPYILEEREMRATQLDIFSRLMMDRIIWVSGPVESQMASIIQAQLIFLETTDKKDISMYLDTPGGSVLSGLGIRDTMNYIKPDVATLNVGMCASMGSVLVSSGTKGKRSSLIFSKIMTHMVSHGTQGNVQDTRINQLEAEKYNYMLFKILAENCGKTFDEMYESSRNDKWFNSDESKAFGLIDNIVGLETNKSMTEMMVGFDEFYTKEILKR